MQLTTDFMQDTAGVKAVAMRSLFERLDAQCDGAMAVDREGRIVWMSDKYLRMLGYAEQTSVLGQPVENIIPHSKLRQVASTGEPILLDVMAFGSENFVVTRMPIIDSAGAVIGAVGFCLYDKLHYLKPLLHKFEKLQDELAETRRQLAENRRTRYTLAHYIGSSSACMVVKQQARRAAQLDTTVLLLGETGTGKELLAQAIHASSERSSKPFIAINTAAIPEALLEAELFGAAAGAYTGADRRGRDGKFKRADGGTLFLDEIGDMPLQMQAKLLRVLQEQEVEPLGANQVIKVDVRIIAATSIDLKQSVGSGRFRSDLYYRLNVLSITLPPLRERLSDLDALCENAFEQMAQHTGMTRRHITACGLERLAAHDWPGNVRELRNVLEKAVLLSDAKQLCAEHLHPILPALPADPNASVTARSWRSLAEVIAEAERHAIRATLQAAGGKKTKAAQMLGISRATLYEKIAALKIEL